MLSISGPIASAAAVRYYVDLTNEDYMTQGGEPVGEWYGQSAKKLGLVGKVDTEVFKDVMEGFLPGRTAPAVQNAGQPDRQRGLDLTFTDPKTVATVWSQGTPEIRAEIRAARRAALLPVLSYLERVALWSRRGHAGQLREPVGMCAAVFEHGTSRAADPCLHTHVVIASLCVRDDGTTGTILSKPLFVHKMVAGALYRAALGKELIARLGLELIQRGTAPFEVAGVVPSLVRTFSKRREQIARLLKEQGQSGPKAASRAALFTRPPKQHIPREELFRIWEEVGRQAGWSTAEAQKLVGRRRLPTGPIPDREIRNAVRHLSEFQAHFTKRDVLRAIADQIQSKGYDVSQIERAAEAALEKLVPLGVVHGDLHYATRGTLRLERELLSRVAAGQGVTRHVIGEQVVAGVVANRPLSEEQKAAVRYVTLEPGNVKTVSGLAGTGKSVMLGAAREAWEKAGLQVIGVALTGKAASSLGHTAGIRSVTLASLLQQMNQPVVSVAGVTLATASAPIAPKAPRWSPLHNVTVPHLTIGTGQPGGAALAGSGPGNRPIASLGKLTLSAAATPVAPNAPQWSPLRNLSLPHLTFGGGSPGAQRIDHRTVVVVDEAGLVGTRQLTDLVNRLTAARAKVVLVGDAKQLPPIEAGAPFRSLASRFGQTTLNDIQRQSHPWAREMVKDLAFGEVRKAIHELNGRGHIHVQGNRSEAVSTLVNDWAKAGHPRDNVILAATREEVAALNKAAQEELQRKGLLTGKSTQHRDQQFHEGDRVLFEVNSKLIGVHNGTLGQIVRLNGDDLVVRLDGGPRVTVPLDRYPHVSLGYAMTSHRAQGMTCENVFSLLSTDFAGREMGYVQASRARNEAHLYVDKATAGENLGGVVELFRPGRLKAMACDIQDGLQEGKPTTQARPEKESSATPALAQDRSDQSASSGGNQEKDSKARARERDEQTAREAKERDKAERERQEAERLRLEREREQRQRAEMERRQRRENDRGRS